MKYTLTVFSTLILLAQSCYLIYDPYCCDNGKQYSNDCFVKEANISLDRCIHRECM